MKVAEELDKILKEAPAEVAEYTLWSVWEVIEQNSNRAAVNKFIDDLTQRLIENVDLNEIIRESRR